MVLSRNDYTSVSTDDESDTEKVIDSFEEDRQASEDGCRWCRTDVAQRSKPSTSKTAVLTLCVVSVLAFLMGAAVASLFIFAGRSRYAQTYSTDFAPARASVESERVEFTGAALFDDEGEPYFNYKEDETQYVGTPTTAMDRAWNELIQHRYFLISDEEALDAWGPGYEQYYKYPPSPARPEGGYVAGLDVLHTLHCVNVLRKTIYKDHYKHSHGSAAFQQYHVDHCLNIVRQSIQCQGDLTLIPTRWWDGLGRKGRNFIDSDQVHTCRNFPKIREWAYERWNKTHKPSGRRPPPVKMGDTHSEGH